MFSARLKIWTLILTATLLLGFPGPSTSSAFSITEERKVGKKLLNLVRKQFRLLDDPDITQYINKLGREVITAAGPQLFDYHFFLVNNRELNAFAAPGGLIVLHSGLLESVDHENELISVITHEVAHATSRHIAGQLEKAKKVNAATIAFMLAGIALGPNNGELSEALITGSMAASASLGLQFSRADEEEADRLAFKWMQKSRRDPEGMVDMLREMRRLHRFRSGSVPTYLLTHPQPSTRIGYIQDLQLFSPGQPYEPVDEFAFQRIKQRVMTLTLDTTTLITQYQGRLTRAVNEPDKTAMAQYGLALAHAREAQYAKAEEYLHKVIGRYPDRTILKVDLGVLYYEAGRYHEALTILQKAVNEDPALAYGSFYLAKTLQRTDKKLQAVQIYRKLLNELPEYAKLHYELGMLKAELGDRGAGFYYLGMSSWLAGKMKTALQNFEQAVEQLPTTDPLAEKARTMQDKIKDLKKKS